MLLKNLSISSNIETLIYKPWTIITHMFIHVDLLHALINLCYLLCYLLLINQFKKIGIFQYDNIIFRETGINKKYNGHNIMKYFHKT